MEKSPNKNPVSPAYVSILQLICIATIALHGFYLYRELTDPVTDRFGMSGIVFNGVVWLMFAVMLRKVAGMGRISKALLWMVGCYVAALLFLIGGVFSLGESPVLTAMVGLLAVSAVASYALYVLAAVWMLKTGGEGMNLVLLGKAILVCVALQILVKLIFLAFGITDVALAVQETLDVCLMVIPITVLFHILGNLRRSLV